MSRSLSGPRANKAVVPDLETSVRDVVLNFHKAHPVKLHLQTPALIAATVMNTVPLNLETLCS